MYRNHDSRTLRRFISLYIICYVFTFSCYFTAVRSQQRIVTEENDRNQMEIHI